MDEKLHLRVITMKASKGDADQYKFDDDVEMVIFRCKPDSKGLFKGGDMGILKNREDISAVLDTGVMRIRDGNEEKRMIVYGGIVQLKNNVLTVLTDSAEWPEDIDVLRADKEYAEAEAAGNRAAMRHAMMQREVSEYKAS